MGRVIAIDGPSGAGKGTVAKLLAKDIGFEYLDTGALYRAVALHFLNLGISPDDDDRMLTDALKGAAVRFDHGTVFLNGVDVAQKIRTPEVGHYSSVFSARKVVRDFLLGVQRDASAGNDLVAEGRDTTTVVFPGAWKKFFLDASMAERTKRRYRQLTEMGIEVTEADAEKDIADRDTRDQEREFAPLTRASDAVVVDTTGKSIGTVLEEMLGLIRPDL